MIAKAQDNASANADNVADDSKHFITLQNIDGNSINICNLLHESKALNLYEELAKSTKTLSYLDE